MFLINFLCLRGFSMWERIKLNGYVDFVIARSLSFFSTRFFDMPNGGSLNIDQIFFHISYHETGASMGMKQTYLSFIFRFIRGRLHL